jgi:hypothetical protein
VWLPAGATTYFRPLQLSPGHVPVVFPARNTIAHHLYDDDGERKTMVASLRCLDKFSKLDGTWRFAECNLVLDWSETRSSPR